MAVSEPFPSWSLLPTQWSGPPQPRPAARSAKPRSANRGWCTRLEPELLDALLRWLPRPEHGRPDAGR